MNCRYNDFDGRRGGCPKPYDYPGYPGGCIRYPHFRPFDHSDLW
jgi:hypothetical protein